MRKLLLEVEPIFSESVFIYRKTVRKNDRGILSKFLQLKLNAQIHTLTTGQHKASLPSCSARLDVVCLPGELQRQRGQRVAELQDDHRTRLAAVAGL